MGIWARFEAAYQAARASMGEPNAPRPRAAFLVTGLDITELDPSLLSEDMVLITDRPSIEALRIPGVVTEHLVTEAPGTAEDLAAYQARRLTVMAVKWTIQELTAVGDDAAALVAIWREREPQAVPEIRHVVAPKRLAGQTVAGRDAEESSG